MESHVIINFYNSFCWDLKALLVLGLRPVRPSWAQKARPTGIRPVDGGTYKREEREREDTS